MTLVATDIINITPKHFFPSQQRHHYHRCHRSNIAKPYYCQVIDILFVS